MAPSLTASVDRLQYVDVYMDNLNFATQGGVGQQQRTYAVTLRALKEIFPSLLSDIKDSVSLKKALQGNGNCAQIEGIFVWSINTHDGTLRLPSKRLAELRIILAIHSSQRRMSPKKLELLIGKLCSIHLDIPGVVRHFYHLQMALLAANHASHATAYLFHRGVQFSIFVCKYRLMAHLLC